jgi:glycerol-3-phosphate dehydrogenase
MTGWDVLNNVINGFPPVALALLLVAAVAAAIVFVIGFARHGVNFIKYGFKQTVLDSTLEKRFDKMEDKFDARFIKLEAKIEAIEVNHFGHLKNYLGVLNGIFLDKGVIDNESKARLDNELRGM